MSSTHDFHEFEHDGWNNHEVCESYDRAFGTVTIQSVPALLDAAGVVSGSRVLDVCTGAGYAAGLAATRGATATGVDFSDAQVKLAQEYYGDATFQVCDGERLPFADASFDAVVNSIGLPHFAAPDEALAESCRVLCSGGRIAFTVYETPDKAIGFGAIYEAVQAHGSLDIALPAGPDFYAFSDRVASKKRLEDAGFTDVSFATIDQTWRPANPDEAILAVREGSVRAGATLNAQTAEALPAIRAAIWKRFDSFKNGDRYEIPMPVVLASAVRP